MATKQLQNYTEKLLTTQPPSGFELVNKFNGYRSKEDITNMPLGFLVPPSQNMIVNTSGIAQTRYGFTLDGQSSTSGQGVTGSFDFLRGQAGDQHVRYTNGQLQYRYVANAGDSWEGNVFTKNQVYWIPLITGLEVGVEPCFSRFYNQTETENVMLMVNGGQTITEWSGAVGTLAFASNNSILGQSTTTATVIEIICSSSVTSLSGSTTTSGNYVVTGSYVNQEGQTLYGGFIVINNNPANNDTLTIVVNGVSITDAFLSSLTYDYNQVLIGSTKAETVNNLLAHLNYPASLEAYNMATPNLGWSPYTNPDQPYVQMSSYNQPMNVQGTFTTAGNTVQTNLGSFSILMPNQPANGDTLTLNLNGISVVFTFVSAIGSNPGNVLIGVNVAATETNLLALLETPGTSTANGIALTVPNQVVINSFTWSQTSTITLNGGLTWQELGFYVNTGSRAIVINGNTYGYSGGETTNTITNVLPNPSAEPVGSIIVQLPIVNQNVNMTDGPSTSSIFTNDIIGTLGNQLYLASKLVNTFYLSKVDNYMSFMQNSPRQPGDGYVGTVDGLITSVNVQDTSMYVSWGQSGWTEVIFTLSSDLTDESVSLNAIKAATQFGSIDQQLTTSIGNDLAFITQEPTLQLLGLVDTINDSPQFTNYSDPIKNDFDEYTSTGFLGGQIIYWKYFMYVSLPTLGKVIRFNFSMGFWDPPFIMPIAKFSIIEGLLYGHDFNTSQTYLLDTGNPLTESTNDNGEPMQAILAMSYDNSGDPAQQKKFTEFYVEGYISQNTTLGITEKYDFGGYNGMPTQYITGTTPNIIFQTTADGSLGRNPIGENPIGSVTDSILNLPKFRVITTTVPNNYFEYQAYFSSNDINQQWAVLRYGPRVQGGPQPSYVKI